MKAVKAVKALQTIRPKFIFECPIESQQSALIAEFGQRVNLAGINPDVISSVE